jgi:signal transduction histidine kinase
MTTPHQHKPSFRWQAALILLPVMVLAAVGWFSLRQDKHLAQREAEDRAQAIADDFVPKIWSALITENTNSPNHLTFQINERGQLIFPPPCPPVPAPQPFDLTTLNPEQARLWLLIQNAETQTSPDSLAQAVEDFLQTDPAEHFAAAAHYNLGLWFTREKRLSEAAERFAFMAEEYPDAVGESGLSLRQLALLKMFEIQPLDKGAALPRLRRSGDAHSLRPPMQNAIMSTFPPLAPLPLPNFISLDFLCSNFVCYPTPLTPYLLQEIEERWIPQIPPRQINLRDPDDLSHAFHPTAPEMQDAIRKWQRVWREHELYRELFAAARAHFTTNVSIASLPMSAIKKGRSGDQAVGALPDQLLSAAASTRTNIEAPRLFWFNTSVPLKTSIPGDGINADRLEIEEQRWLAFRADTNASGSHYLCLAESEVGLRIHALLKEASRLPEYFGLGIELVGKPVQEFAPSLRVWQHKHYGGKGGRVAKEFLDEFATNIMASASLSGQGSDLRVNIHLTNPALLYRSQRDRALLFGMLILLAIVAAVIGLVAAWTAFNRQLRLNDMKSNFVSSVSHELRAPIASVRLLAESLERGKISEPAKQNEYFRFIGQECRRLSALIENVLDFSRIEQGRKQYEFEPTDLNALVEQTVKLMQPYAEERGVRLETSNVQRPMSNIELNVDGRAIQQALVNLIDNAIKHSPKGEAVTVILETVGETSDAQRPTSNVELTNKRRGASLNPQPSTLNLSVSDSGPGIPASEHEKIFERFYRLGSELRRETQGVGIGLSIVKHVVEAHGGRVRVESEVGKGSCFTIELPIETAETLRCGGNLE